MNKGLLSKILILLILLMTTGIIFWFLKTSSVKKSVVAYISESKGQIVAEKVSISGFPFSQKIMINNLKFASGEGSQRINPLNKYQITIERVEALSSIFSNQFKIIDLSGLSFQDVNGNSGKLNFKKPPLVEFTITDRKIEKFSYKDSGYKIVDTNNNIIFENGESLISFESLPEPNDITRSKVKVEFKDVSGVGLFESPNSINPNPASDLLESSIQATPANNKVQTDSGSRQPIIAETGKDVVKGASSPDSSKTEVKKPIKGNFYMELEYTVGPKVTTASDSSQSTAKTLTSPDAQLPPSGLPEEKQKDFTLNQISIKNIELSSESYKVIINAELNGDEKDLPSGSLTIKVSGLSNAVNESKKFFLEASKENSPLAVSDIANQGSVVSRPGEESSGPTPVINNSQSESSVLPSPEKKPEPDVFVIISDLAKKNQNTSAEVAVFSFKKEKGKEATVNDAPLTEIMNQLFLSSVVNQNSSNETK